MSIHETYKEKMVRVRKAIYHDLITMKAHEDSDVGTAYNDALAHVIIACGLSFEQASRLQDKCLDILRQAVEGRHD